MTLKDKVAIVSGGSRGIGRSVVLAMAQKGAKVAFTYLNSSQAAQEVVGQGNSLCGTVKAYKVDAKDPKQIQDMLTDIVHEWRGLDIVVNNAGIKKDKTLPFMSFEDWNNVLQTNLTGTFYLTKASIYHLLKRRQGRIINIGSLSGISGIAGQTNYSSSKAALIGFTRSLAKEVAPYGICVNLVAPGGVDTDMLKEMKEKDLERLLQEVPMGRFCTPEEVAQVVLFLADDEQSPAYLTGVVIPLHGGYGL